MYDIEDTENIGDDLHAISIGVQYDGRWNAMDVSIDDDWVDRADERAQDLTWLVFALGGISWCVVILLFTLAIAAGGTLVGIAALICLVIVEYLLVAPPLERMLGWAEQWRDRNYDSVPS